jgi:hypothetical protein
MEIGSDELDGQEEGIAYASVCSKCSSSFGVSVWGISLKGMHIR